MSVPLKSCLIICGSVCVLGMTFIAAVENIVQKSVGLGIVVASIGIILGIVTAAELE
jgi:hypothetical protein